MSLKAKIEAVIYASEEPVTLQQLAGLLGGEAEAELRARAEAQQTLRLADGGADEADSDLLNGGKAKAPEPEGEEQPVAAALSLQPSGEGESAAGEMPIPEPAIEGAESPQEAARRLRSRDREVREFFRDLLDGLMRDYAEGDRGLEIREVAGGFRLATKPEYHDAVRGFVRSLKPPLKLSLQALETLAVVAYKQPITAPEISEIRGVDSGGVLGSLLARKLISTAGRKQVIGRPILYKTTKDFLLRFGLKDIGELPSIEEFERLAGELRETEPVQEEIPMANDFGAESPHTDPELRSVGPTDVIGTTDGGGSIDNGPISSPPSQGSSTIPQADGSDEPLAGETNVENKPVDSPSIDAEIQSGERDGGA